VVLLRYVFARYRESDLYTEPAANTSLTEQLEIDVDVDVTVHPRPDHPPLSDDGRP